MRILKLLRTSLPVAMALAAMGVPGFAQGSEPDPIFSEIGEIVQTLSDITGLAAKQPVPYERIGEQGLRDFLTERMKEEVEPGEIELEEKVLKKFGFVPPDYDLKSATLDLLTEQAAAFYDYRKKKLYLVETHGDAMMRVALVHELAHALADQHFDLGKFLDETKEEDDQSLARMAVMEGQASWLMAEFMARQANQSLLDSDAIFRVLSQASESEASNYPVFRNSSLYVKVTLLFPYTKGMYFQQEVLKKAGKEGFSRVFTEPPVSTHQILHPQDYLDKTEPVDVTAPDPHAKGYEQITDGRLGEVDAGVLMAIASSRPEGEEAAAGWRGGGFRFFEEPKQKKSILTVATQWNSPESARRFFELYPWTLKKKWKSFSIATQKPGFVAGRGDDGYFAIMLSGDEVRSLEGLPAPYPAPAGTK